MFYGLLIGLHVVAGIFLIFIILIQAPKGEGLSGAFGIGGSATTFFGGDTGNVLTKGTAVLAVIFTLTCITLAAVQVHQSKGVTGGEPRGVVVPPVSVDVSETQPAEATEKPPAGISEILSPAEPVGDAGETEVL